MKQYLTLTLFLLGILVLSLSTSCKRSQVNNNLVNHAAWYIDQYRVISYENEVAYQDLTYLNYGYFIFYEDGTGWYFFDEDGFIYEGDMVWGNTKNEVMIVIDDEPIFYAIEAEDCDYYRWSSTYYFDEAAGDYDVISVVLTAE